MKVFFFYSYEKDFIGQSNSHFSSILTHTLTSSAGGKQAVLLSSPEDSTSREISEQSQPQPFSCKAGYFSKNLNFELLLPSYLCLWNYQCIWGENRNEQTRKIHLLVSISLTFLFRQIA